MENAPVSSSTPKQAYSEPRHILIIDDDASVNTSLQDVLSTLGYQTSSTLCGHEALKKLEKENFDLVLCDLKLPEISGLDVLKQYASKVPIILMTAYSTEKIAKKAAACGAFDYIRKPIFPDDLLFTLNRFETHHALQQENKKLKETLAGGNSFQNIIAKSQSFLDIFDIIKRLAPFNTTVLITGESGTGKELVAKAIHDTSPRKDLPFVAINCGAIPENLIESELFGHKKGAFTDASRDKRGLFEEANGGTLFLDEVGDLPLHLQVKILRALQEQRIRRVGDEQSIKIDVRIISATLRNLDKEMAQGRFRDDLLYRLNVISIHLPPLRERPEDISLLIEYFVQKHAVRLGISPKIVGADVLKALLTYPWPGNARELENCLERALVLSDGEHLELSSLPSHVAGNATQLSADTQSPDNLSIKAHTTSIEIDLIKRALVETKGNRTQAARLLEISHRTLLYKLKEYDIS